MPRLQHRDRLLIDATRLGRRTPPSSGGGGGTVWPAVEPPPELRDQLLSRIAEEPVPLRRPSQQRRWPRMVLAAAEQDCLRAYRQLLGDTPAVVYLERLTEAWTRTAWAHRPTTPEQVQALYDQWRGLRPAEART